MYPEHIQERPDISALKESDAWPAKPQVLSDEYYVQIVLVQDAYGLEKLVTEEMVMVRFISSFRKLHDFPIYLQHYQKDWGMQGRIARFHNIYGPQVSRLTQLY